MSRSAEIADLLVGERLRDLVFDWVEPEEVASPYRELLCHARDMTSTLARFHGGEVMLEVLQEPDDAECYVREVLLKVAGEPVEYGLIRIYLENFPPEMRSQITGGEKPLGGILNESGMAYTSRPGGYLRIAAAQFEPDFFPSTGGAFLFGRYNELIGPEQVVLARIIEILPRKTP